MINYETPPPTKRKGIPSLATLLIRKNQSEPQETYFRKRLKNASIPYHIPHANI